MMTRDSTSNREKIYSAGGKALFGKVYNCAEAPSGGSFQALISMYKATKSIMKSPNARNNRNKICKKGKRLCAIGVVTDNNDNREYLVFSEDTWVFKREWAELKDFVTPVGICLQEIEVIKTGATKYKDNGNTCHEQQQQRFDCAFAVQFTNDPRSVVWFTQAGLQYLAEQTCALSEAGLLPQNPRSLCLFPHWPQPCDTLTRPLLAQNRLTECTDSTNADTYSGDSDDCNNDKSGSTHKCSNTTKHQDHHSSSTPPSHSTIPSPLLSPSFNKLNEELEDLSADQYLSDVHDLYPYI